MRRRDCGIEFVAMYYQEAFAAGTGMNEFLDDSYVSELVVGIGVQRDVVVAGNIDDTGAPLCFAEQDADDIVVLLWPVGSALQCPQVNDVADEVEGFALDTVQEVEQRIGAGGVKAEVKIRDPDTAEVATSAATQEMLHKHSSGL